MRSAGKKGDLDGTNKTPFLPELVFLRYEYHHARESDNLANQPLAKDLNFEIKASQEFKIDSEGANKNLSSEN